MYPRHVDGVLRCPFNTYRELSGQGSGLGLPSAERFPVLGNRSIEKKTSGGSVAVEYVRSGGFMRHCERWAN